jgi:Zn-dependent M28 family amino/carboxypeptidase
MEKFGHALAAGAEAFVLANHVPGQLPPTGTLRFGEEAAAPAVGVASEAGEWLREYAGGGGRARLAVEASTADATSRNVVGHVGPDSRETVLLVAHYDGHDVGEGALDNACGVATLVTATRVLAACDDLPVGVTVALVGCEEVGLLGAEHLADRLDLEQIRAVVNVDGAGRHRDPVAMTHASEAVGEAVGRVADRTRQPVTVDPDPHPFSDHWPFVRRGVPALQVHSDSGERGRGWGHTRADTRDKVDDRTVREHAMLTALLVEELAGTDLPRLPESTLVAALRENEYERGMRAADLWPDEWD